MKKILLLGAGGRAYSIARSLKKREIELITWAPSINPGIAALSSKIIEQPFTTNINTKYLMGVDLAIIANEKPLVMGISDMLSKMQIPVFGPTKKNARIEGSKIYMRELMTRYNIMGNVEYDVCSTVSELEQVLDKNHMVAVKPDGLTGGKGVKVFGDHFKTKDLVFEYAYDIMKRDKRVLLEELICGVEFSLQAFVKGKNIIFLPLVKDYKRAYENDVGQNTGSMGSCSFVNHKLPYLTDEEIKFAQEIIKEVINALNHENGEYVGAIYGQFMKTEGGIKLIEINARMGDPEAINVLALMETSILDVIEDLMNNKKPDVKFINKATVCVYLVPMGYPENPQENIPINMECNFNDTVICASLKKENDKLLTTKSRSLAIIGYGNDIKEAREMAYNLIPSDIQGLRYRKDIAQEFISEDNEE